MVSVRYKNTFSKSVGFAKNNPVKTGILLVALSTAALLVIIVLLATADKTTNTQCISGSKSANQANESITSKEKLIEARDTAKIYERDCAERSTLGISRDDTKTKLSQVQYYHDKSTAAYMLGEKESARSDAEKGLAIDAQLSQKDRTLKNHAQLVKDMEYVRDGKF